MKKIFKISLFAIIVLLIAIGSAFIGDYQLLQGDLGNAKIDQIENFEGFSGKLEKATAFIDKLENSAELKTISSIFKKHENKLKKNYKKKDYSALKNELNNLNNELGELEFNREELNKIIYELRYILGLRIPNSKKGSLTKIPQPQGQTSKDIRIVVCMMRWNQRDNPVNQAQISSNTQQITDWYREVSYNQSNLIFTFVGNHIWNSGVPSTPRQELEYAVASCDPEINFSQIDGFIVTPSPTSQAEGVAARGGPERDVVTQEGNFNFSFVRLGSPTNFSGSVMQHELGHALFNLQHANSLECGNQSFNSNFRQANGPCQKIEYGNPFSNMSLVSNGHFSAWEKHLAGPWGGITSVLQDGTYQLQTLEKAPQTNNILNTNLLRIPFQNHAVCIEYRKPILNDSAFSISSYTNQGFPGGIPSQGCLFINICSRTTQIGQGGRDVLLIDTTPNSQPNYVSWVDFLDACLEPGRVYSESTLGINEISFQPNNSITDSANVQLNIDEGDLATQPDIFGGLFPTTGINNAACLLNDLKLEIVNSTEVEISIPFKIQLYGKNPASTESVFWEKTINHLHAGDILNFYHINGSGYEEIRTFVDSQNAITELNEINNQNILRKSCN